MRIEPTLGAQTRFQYPLTDRGGCNPDYIIVSWDYLIVSVSTNGSRRVQLRKRVFRTLPETGFSIH